MKQFAVIPAITLLLACGSGGPPVQVVKLPSGRNLKVLSVMKMHFSNDDPALVLNYQTDLKTSDLPALQREVDEIWETFRIDVERANLTNALIRANEIPKGFIISTSQAYGFSFRKKQDGQWSRQS